MSGARSGIRWRDDVGWELRCDDCVRRGEGPYWPLTEEFWNKRWMTKCLVCHKVDKNRKARAEYARDWKRRAEAAAKSRAYRLEAHDAIVIKRQQNRAKDAYQSKLRYWLDPEGERAKSRAYYWRNRDRIVEKRRADYRRKAA